jgi:hypothetical protein
MNSRTVAFTAALIAVLLALAGIEQGLFEAIQGNQQTAGNLIQAIGRATRWWGHGGEYA